MTEAQRLLHDAANLQAHAWGTNLDPEAKPERPQWANKAFVYLLPQHAACIERVVKEAGIEVQSKHIVVSQDFKEIVERALADEPEGFTGRERGQIHRAGKISEESRILMPGYTFEDLRNMRKGEAEAAFAAAAPVVAVPVPSSPSCPPPPRKSEVHMLQLKKDEIMEDRDLDEYLLEYLTAPASVQMLSPETWLDVWQHVCSENQDWLEMRVDPRCGLCPYCRICRHRADLSHLRSMGCESKRREEGITRVGHVLRAILEAEKDRGNNRRPPGSMACLEL